MNGKAYAVRFEGDRALVNGRRPTTSPSRPSTTGAPHPLRPPPRATVVAVTAPMLDWCCASTAQEGDVVERHDELLVLEAMKMESKISATTAGTVRAILVKQGDQVKAGDVLVEIEA